MKVAWRLSEDEPLLLLLRLRPFRPPPRLARRCESGLELELELGLELGLLLFLARPFPLDLPLLPLSDPLSLEDPLASLDLLLESLLDLDLDLELDFLTGELERERLRDLDLDLLSGGLELEPPELEGVLSGGLLSVLSEFRLRLAGLVDLDLPPRRLRFLGLSSSP
jgi:hypothetical protein